MQFIAEDLEDSTEKLRGKLATEKARPQHAIDRYFYPELWEVRGTL